MRYIVSSEPQKKWKCSINVLPVLWENLVAYTNDDFPSKELFDYFDLILNVLYEEKVAKDDVR